MAKELILKPHTRLFRQDRKYYEQVQYRNTFCKDVDGQWYFCSRDGEPQEAVNFTMIEDKPRFIKVLEPSDG
ncbi:hypothetical protein [Alteromonas mediterranea]|uniref:Uncharacterized protein n=1 Tax=Alteromonas mediterranea (strain DSM 17117 / CIP 110805 / LMG 28347 / Deep ecotype) TaxID=1774373 RepID=F2GCA9_ALTMD|nr:hypothetical protein [Alteromonas mediterranea]AEA99065.1 hypothetical protein MADE_1014655 [Alteromonas mediterranea DE]